MVKLKRLKLKRIQRLMAIEAGAGYIDLNQIQTFPVVIEGYGMLTPNKLPGGFHGTQRIDGSGTGDAFVFGRIARNSVR